MAGTTAAVDFLAGIAPNGGSRRERMRAAMACLEAYEDELRHRIEAGLAGLPAVTVHSRAHRRTPTLLVTFANHTAADVSAHLAAAQSINAPAGSFYAYETSRHLGLGDTGGLRIGLAPYNTLDDVDRLISALGSFL
jgi:selenocysteine lyase/cysteine desulfurase